MQDPIITSKQHTAHLQTHPSSKTMLIDIMKFVKEKK